VEFDNYPEVLEIEYSKQWAVASNLVPQCDWEGKKGKKRKEMRHFRLRHSTFSLPVDGGLVHEGRMTNVEG
jgi:hypothetical protein